MAPPTALLASRLPAAPPRQHYCPESLRPVASDPNGWAMLGHSALECSQKSYSEKSKEGQTWPGRFIPQLNAKDHLGSQHVTTVSSCSCLMRTCVASSVPLHSNVSVIHWIGPSDKVLAPHSAFVPGLIGNWQNLQAGSK